MGVCVGGDGVLFRDLSNFIFFRFWLAFRGVGRAGVEMAVTLVEGGGFELIC